MPWRKMRTPVHRNELPIENGQSGWKTALAVWPPSRKSNVCPWIRLTGKIYLVLNRGGLACTNFEEALAVKEVITKVNPDDVASDAALEELKRWKEKLDLQIITQEEYDAKKAELMKKIK